MRIAGVAASGGASGGEASSDLYALLARGGPRIARVTGETPAGGLQVTLAGHSYELPPGNPFPAGTLVQLSADPQQPGVIHVEAAPSESTAPSVQAGDLAALLDSLGLPATPLYHTLAGAILGLGLPVGADTLSALAEALPGLLPQQVHALQFLLQSGLPISENLISMVESWLSAGTVEMHLAEVLAAGGGGPAAEALSKWILRLEGGQAKDTAGLATQLRLLLSPFAAPSEGKPLAEDLPAQLARFLSESGGSSQGTQLLGQLRVAQTLSGLPGTQATLLFPLFLSMDGEESVAWARMEREAGGGEKSPSKATTRFTLALTLSRLGPLQVDLALSGESLRVGITLTSDAALGAARESLPELSASLAAQGFRIEGVDAHKSATLAANLLEETLRRLLAHTAHQAPRVEFRA